jgi:hypothetical protein
MTSHTDMNAINALLNCYRDRGLKLSVLAEDPELREESLRQITLTSGDSGFEDGVVVTVFDEFRDADCQNPVLWLHLVMDACAGFEESRDYDEWRLNEGFKDTAFFQSLFAQYAALMPVVRMIVGDGLMPLDAFHFELNTGTAKALRVLTP